MGSSRLRDRGLARRGDDVAPKPTDLLPNCPPAHVLDGRNDIPQRIRAKVEVGRPNVRGQRFIPTIKHGPRREHLLAVIA
ncbi:hypothetical protein D9M68_946680 [compost metagenome]